MKDSQPVSSTALCNNIVAVSGSTVNCSALTPDQKRALERIPSMLKQILADQPDPNVIIDKLDEILREKQAREQEFLKLKYSLVLDDNKILEKIHSFENDKNGQMSMGVDLSPTSGTAGQPIKSLWIKVPCPRTLQLKYKVIDPSNYGMQNITPLYPVISLADDQKYYIGFIIVPQNASPTDKLIIVTKHTNELIEVENLDIATHTFDMSNFQFKPFNE